jgi:predicted dehydrogenase
MEPIRTGVVGVGHLGYHHARLYHTLEDTALIGVVDPDPETAARARDDFGVPSFRTVEDLIHAGVQAVSVVVPTRGHHAVTRELLANGIDVLVEKPIAATLDEAREMVALAEQHGRLLQVGHIERFNGAVIALLGAFQAPRFIECHRLSPYPMRGHDVSVVHDLMIHDLEIVLAMDKSGVAAVDASGVAVFSPTEDIANARIRFHSGCVANITASRISVEKLRKIRLFSAEAYVSTDYSEQEVMVYRKKEGPVPEGVNPMMHITIEPLPVTREEPLKLELADFARCVRERRQPIVTGQDGLDALALAERIVEIIHAQG